MSEWISVEDRLPNRDCKVIVCAHKIRGGFIKKERFITTAVFCMTMIDKHYFDFKSNGDGIVTHWMPLPELPKEDVQHELR